MENTDKVYEEESDESPDDYPYSVITIAVAMGIAVLISGLAIVTLFHV